MTMNCKFNKKALLASVLSLLLCMAMLVGTTFAWFTDTASSTGNKIVAGKLNIDLELLDKETGIWESVKENKDPIFTYEDWEPGYIDAKILRVENQGSLALKWKAVFVSNTSLSDLANVIDVYVKAYGVLENDSTVAYPTARTLDGYNRVGTVAEFVNTIEQTTYGTLLEGETAYLGIALKMQESAGNEYQEMDLGAFDINIVATQFAAEFDSIDNQYDAGATYPVIMSTSAPVVSGQDTKLSYTSENGAVKSADVVVPKDAALEAGVTELTLTINEAAEADATVKVTDSQKASTYNIDIKGLADGNTVPVKVTLTIDKGLENVKLYHKSALIASTYDAATGVLAFETTGFSPFTVVNTVNKLVSADVADVQKDVQAGGDVVLADSVTIDANLSSGYGKAAIVVDNGAVLDGQGKTVVVTGSNGTWDCGVNVRGGTVKNLVIDGAFRGIFMGGATSDVVIENVTVKNVVYTFNSDAGSKNYSVTLKNCVLNGWTSYSNCHKIVTFDNCDFGEGSGYAFLRAYNTTEFKNCRFSAEDLFEVQVIAGATATFENCYYGDTLITAENIMELGLIYGTDASLVSVIGD